LNRPENNLLLAQ